MGKAQKRTGKGRLDKYYKLAKEQGYRARSAFKLIQLNKKYSFLENARCCIDLCAAPGGWLQVASKYMPVNSIIVGVDLVPIKPIPRVVTFAADITTPQCQNLIRNELKDWKADVVLHDGAPNVGTAWIQDAYSQSELVLMSLKLAVEFLIKGGTFVTKVFRSVDYNNLIWVFNQLFGKVEATKPPSSRNVSAEIFVVCREFLAPKYIDPKFLDPRHVFKDITSLPSGVDKGTSANNIQANVFQPEKKRRQRDGYDSGDYILFKKISANEFIRSMDPVSLLGAVNKITFEAEEENEWAALEITTEDVKTSCEDLKVLGKGDFKALLKWRLLLREEIGLDVKRKEAEELTTEAVEISDEVDEEQQIQEELARLNAEAAARAKRERRRANEIKTRTIQRMQLQMTAPLEIGMEQQDVSLSYGQDVFDLDEAETGLRKKGGITALVGEDMGSFSEGESDNTEVSEGSEAFDSEEEQERKVIDLEAELDGLYHAYQERLRERDAKYKVKEARKKGVEREEWHGIAKANDESEESESGWDKMEEAKMNTGESSSDYSDESGEDEAGTRNRKRKHSSDSSPQDSKRTRSEQQKLTPTSRTAHIWFSQGIFDGVGDLSETKYDESDISEMDISHRDDNDDDLRDVSYSDDDLEIVPQENPEDSEMWDASENKDTKKGEIQKFDLLTPEAVTLAQQLVNREKTKTQLINDGFNRYSLNSKDGLPSWFLDDEAKHYKSNLPVTKEAIAALRAKQRALNVRPMKKVAEAKARKKLRAQRRLEKAMKEAEGINATSDMSEREKAQQIEKLMHRGLSAGRKPKKDTKVIVAKGAFKGVRGRPRGVKGRYTMVDSRMKKEARAKKRREKAKKKRKL